jgi:hypothetical protein
MMMNDVPDVSALTRAFLRWSGMTQETLAGQASVSQATVSRAVRGQAIRSGQAKTRLFIFIHQAIGQLGPVPAVDALLEIWDGTTQHAEALAGLISASSELWPKLGED